MFTIQEYKEIIAELNDQIIDYRNKNIHGGNQKRDKQP